VIHLILDPRQGDELAVCDALCGHPGGEALEVGAEVVYVPHLVAGIATNRHPAADSCDQVFALEL
jgi:hypothetical protein